MNVWKPLTALVAVAAASVAACGGSEPPPAAPRYEGQGPVARREPQPTMEAARARLVEARALLERAEHDKGGHRVRAIEYIDQALVQVDEGISFADR